MIIDKFLLTDRVAVVTGGERGIGLTCAVALAEAGADIVIAGIDAEAMVLAKTQIEATGRRCMVKRVDVTVENTVQSLVNEVLDQFGRIDILLNNAGGGKGGPAEDMPIEDFRRIVDLNLTGEFIVAKAVGQVMLKQGKGSIINVASLSAFIVNTPQPQCNYNASKAGVVQLTKSLACEWATRGVRVNAICPGYIRTALIQKRLLAEDDPVMAEWLRFTPMRRIGEPEEIVGAVIYLASDASSFMTGATMSIDGGYSCY